MASDATFGDYLVRAIDSAGMTQAQLARATGISDSVISRWRRDESAPDLPNLRKLASALRVPLLDLAVAAGHMSPAEARMKDRPDPPAAPVGAGVDPDVLAELAQASPEAIEAVRAVLRAAKGS
jgi:transcriptional regulator with XRE-family HTH domain